jgi:hypothetical protein
MTTRSLRQRKLLSMSRRAGLQLDADAALGRHPRHARSWRDEQHDDSLDAPRGIFAALVYSFIGWLCVGIVVVLAMGW